ncbi:alpha/beta fold hydrolase [Shewanella maritima]|uniref:alpha/beta fold hydrolase n=1 Tax=Shewanella maritima TaxID=2520507 RepID=UPI0037355DB1
MVEDGQRKQLINQGFKTDILALEHGGELSYIHSDDKSKPALILLHGIGGTALNTWFDVIELLQDDFYIIAPDLVWFGQSYSAKPATLQAQTQAISELIQHLELPQTFIAGLSYGGFVTFDLMINEPHIAKAVMLASPGVFITDDDLSQLTLQFGQTDIADVFVPQDRQDTRLLLEHSFANYPWYPWFIDEQIHQLYFAPNADEKRNLIDSLPEYRDELLSLNITDDLPPSMLIWGESDNIFTLAQGRDFAQYLDSEILVIAKGSHTLSNDFPEQVSEAIRKYFLDE